MAEREENREKSVSGVILVDASGSEDIFRSAYERLCESGISVLPIRLSSENALDYILAISKEAPEDSSDYSFDMKQSTIIYLASSVVNSAIEIRQLVNGLKGKELDIPVIKLHNPDNAREMAQIKGQILSRISDKSELYKTAARHRTHTSELFYAV